MTKKLKIDFHTHTADDPEDYIDYSSEALIDRAAALGFDAVAITNHGLVTTGRNGLAEYAASKNVLLIPGVELSLSNRHVVLLNPPFDGRPAIDRIEDLPSVRTDSTLVIAPHPFYPGLKCLRSKLVKHIDSFDAVEFSFFYSRLINPNKRAVRVAGRAGKPLVGSSDCHNIWQIGRTYSLVDADKNIASIIAAVKAGKVEVGTTPLSMGEMMRVAVNFALGDRLKVHLKV